MGNRARMEIAVYPLGTGDPGVSREVSRIFDILDRSGLEYQITVMGTVIEGPVSELFALAHDLHSVVFTDSIRRVVTVMRIDERRQTD